MKTDKFYKYAFILAAAYIVVFLLMPGKKDEAPQPASPSGSGAILLDTTKDAYHWGEAVVAKVENHSAHPFVFRPYRCPAFPFDLVRQGGASGTGKIGAEPTAGACDDAPVEIPAGETKQFKLDAWYAGNFSQGGPEEARYDLSFDTDGDPSTPPAATSFTVGNRGFIGRIWDLLVFQPIYNLLILLVSILPGRDLGWAIILLTIIIRLILLIPNQKALESQKKLQLIQPRINEIQEKYKGDTKRIGEETMKLWKENGVNPMGSCLPLLLQMPFLIALYYAVSHGLEQSSTFYLYEPLKDFAIGSIHSNFLGILDLSRPNVYVLPVLLVVLQWYQMHLTVTNKAAKTKTDLSAEASAKADPNKVLNQAMKYAMPILIGVMSINFPAGVAVYWGMSTVFGIAQQLWVNKMAPSKLK